MKLSNALNLYKTLLEIRGTKFPAKVSYAIDKNLNRLVKVVSEFEMEKFKLMMKLTAGNFEPETGEPIFTEESKKEFESTLLEMTSKEIEFEVHKVNFAEFKNAELSAEDIQALREYGMLLEVL